MGKNEIIERMARVCLVERYVYRFVVANRELLKELAQEVYLALLNYPEERIVACERNGKTHFLAFRIAKNMLFSATSPFYYKFLQYENRRATFEE